MTDPDFIVAVLKIMADADDHRSLSWDVDKEGDVSFHIDCSDVFYWGCGDAEEVTPDNVEILRQSYADIYAIAPLENHYTASLFAARIRKLRPQGAAYPEIPRLWPLFDACGPERRIDMVNPKEHPAKRQEAQKVVS